MSHRIWLALWIAVLMLAARQSIAAQEPNPDAQESESQGRSREVADQIARALEICDANSIVEFNALIFRDPAASDHIASLAERWFQAREKPNESACLNQPQIAMYVANTLAQGYSNGYAKGIDVEPVAAALREGALSSDYSIAFPSISGLAAIARPEDIRLFERIATSAREPMRTFALRALASQCSQETEVFLDGLSKQPSYADVGDIRQDMAFLRSSRCKK